LSSSPSGSPVQPVKIAIIGDLHGSFDAADASYFNRSDYDLLLLTGDLGSGTAQNGIAVAREVARLEKPTLVVAGNNDAPFAGDIGAEFKYQGRLAALMRSMRTENTESGSSVILAGYDLRSYTVRDYSFSVLVGRPYSRGGPEVAFQSELEERYGVRGFERSRERLFELIEAAPHRDVLWLAHNGPTGLGSEPTDIWGCDFKAEGGDWGDIDLEEAIFHTRTKKRLLAVIAGHMHRTIRHAGKKVDRTSVVEKGGALYVNPAVVPRIVSGEFGPQRHHMLLELTPGQPARVADVWVEDG
jgi:uncharacterized protein (TIGR04168 family)